MGSPRPLSQTTVKSDHTTPFRSRTTSVQSAHKSTGAGSFVKVWGIKPVSDGEVEGETESLKDVLVDPGGIMRSTEIRLTTHELGDLGIRRSGGSGTVGLNGQPPRFL
jgi:hypothetical protein